MAVLYIMLFVEIMFSLIVEPEIDNDIVLNNPYMGYQISNDGEVGNFNHSTVYLRANGNCRINGDLISMPSLNWDTLNPSDGVYDFSSIDTLIDCCEANDKFGHIRMRNLVSQGDDPSLPSYLSGIIPMSDDVGNNAVELEYYTCSFLENWGKLVEALWERIKDEDVINMIDIGSVGSYGEWDTYKFSKDVSAGYYEYDANRGNIRVSLDTTRRIIHMFTGGKGYARCLDSDRNEVETYYDYPGFDKKYLFVNQGMPQTFRIGFESGAGWRNDIVGDFYPTDVNQDYRWKHYNLPLFEDHWKHFPNVGEWPKDLDIVNNYDRLICQLKTFHISALHDNTNGEPLPHDLFEDLFKLMGYRIYLKSAEYTATVEAGSTLDLTLTFANDGTSPAYKKYPLVVYLKRAGVEDPVLCESFPDVDIRTILPDDGYETLAEDFSTCSMKPVEDTVFSEIQLSIPSWVESSSDYGIYFAFMEDVRQRPIELAHSKEKQDSFGRYYIGSLSITSGGDGVDPSPPNSCQSVEFIPLEQETYRPSQEDDDITRSYVFEPVKDRYSYRWGESDEEELSCKFGSKEAYLEFDLNNMEYVSEDVFVSAQLNLVPWSRYDWRHVFCIDYFTTEWSELDVEDWDNRPSVVAGDREFLGNYTHMGDRLTTLEVADDWRVFQEKMMGKKFTLMLYAVDEAEHSGTYASSRRNNGLVSPWLSVTVKEVERDDDNDDVLEDDSATSFFSGGWKWIL